MKNLLRSLIRQRARLLDQLQVLEMQMGVEYMEASPLNDIYLDLDALCRKVRNRIDKTPS